MDKKTISRDGTELAYARAGQGPAVILVSGAMSTGGTVAPLAGLLARSSTVLWYDRRGRGGSGDTAPYAVEREVEDLAALIDAAGGEAALYGISSGGALALEAAASGLPVRRVAVYEVPYALDEEAADARAAYTARLTEALDGGRRGDAVELFLRLTGLAEEMIQRARQSPMWAGMEAIAPTLAYDDAVLAGGRVPRDRLASVGVPVLAAAGGDSPPWLREAARAAAEAVPDGTYRALEGETHMVDPNVLAAVLGEFFDLGISFGSGRLRAAVRLGGPERGLVRAAARRRRAATRSVGNRRQRGRCACQGPRPPARSEREALGRGVCQETPAVARSVEAIVAEPTTRVPSYRTIAWPGATPRTGSVKVTRSSPSTGSAVTSHSPPCARSWAV